MPRQLQNEALRVEVVPELGGKLSSLVDLLSGREHLLQPPEHAHRAAEYGAPFEQYDTSGFDECFPTVGACTLSDGVFCPDHGELWPVAWEVMEQNATAIALMATGTVWPYLFRRRLTLQNRDVILEYEVENAGDRDFPYLWSAHPLFRVSPGDRVLLPPQTHKVAVEWSANQRLEGSVAWSEDSGRLTGPELGQADKLFTGVLEEGWCALRYHDGGSLTVRFCPTEIPHLGLWLCQGGWPGGDRPGHFTVALEPCTAPCDRLDHAVARGYARLLGPKQRVSWGLRLEVRAETEKES